MCFPPPKVDEGVVLNILDLVGLLDEQREKFKRDFKMVEQKGFEFTKQEYMWAWIIGFFAHLPLFINHEKSLDPLTLIP